jgi:uncharacterized delta-60 repeat protein
MKSGRFGRIFLVVKLLTLLPLHACFLIPKDNFEYSADYKERDKPAPVNYLSSESLYLAGNRSCALGFDKKLWCWGDNALFLQNSEISQIKLYSDVGDEEEHFEGVTQSENMLCGHVPVDGNEQSVLCRTSTQADYVYAQDDGDVPQTFSKLSAGQDFACGITVGGSQVECFGENQYGRGLGAVPSESEILQANRISFPLPIAVKPGAKFNAQIRTIKHLPGPDRKLLVGGEFNNYGSSSNPTLTGPLARLMSNGDLDTAFTNNFRNSVSLTGATEIRDFLVQADGKIIVVGGFQYSGKKAIMRLNENGSLDSTFGIGAGFSEGLSVTEPMIYAIAEHKDAELEAGFTDGFIVVGSFKKYKGSNVAHGIARLNYDGSLDTNFNANLGTGFNLSAIAIAIQKDGKILVGGNFFTLNGVSIPSRFVRLNSDGSIDTAFSLNAGSGFTNNVMAIGLDHNDGIWVGGAFGVFNGNTVQKLAKLRPDGSLDTVVSGKIPYFDSVVRSVQEAPDGHVYVASQSDIPRVLKIKLDGTQDTQFRIPGIIDGHSYAMSIAEDSSIVVGGASGILSRFNNHKFTDIQAAGNSACAQVELRIDGHPNQSQHLYCWGLNSYRELRNSFLTTFIAPQLSKANIDKFLLTPARLCTKVVGDDDWECQGANYMNPSDPQILTGNPDIDNLEVFSVDKDSVDTYQFSATTLFSGFESSKESFETNPLGCNLNGGILSCHGFLAYSNTLGGTPTSWIGLPTDAMIGGDIGAKSFALGKNHGCLITNDDFVHCWGDNSLGQVGTGFGNSPAVSKPTPVIKY